MTLSQALTSSLAVALLAAMSGGCDDEEAATPSPSPATEPSADPAPQGPSDNEPIAPLPETVEVDAAKVALGRRLYFDTALSGDGTVACVTCHSFDHGGAEPRPTSIGIRGQVGPINSPTVLNAAHNVQQFWDGRAADLVAQAEGPVANPLEMGADWEDVVRRLGEDEGYRTSFAAIYDDGVTKANATDAIAEFERSLNTPSRFDAYLRGQVDAITEEERAGYATFKEVGCATCHNGINVGGSMFQKMGLVRDYFADRGTPITDADRGRYNVTRQDSDQHVFKVPTLRNIEHTAPYLHDGSQQTMADVVKVMGRYQLGRDLSEVQTNGIIAFLRSLSGTLPPHAAPPEAAGSTAPAGANSGG